MLNLLRYVDGDLGDGARVMVEKPFGTDLASSAIEPLLNRHYVASIQITMAEKFDVSDRGRFYDRTGAIRDVLQPGSDIRPYDRLIGAALDGDRWLFASQDTVEAAWKIVDPVLGDAVPVHPYSQGSWGPREADRLPPSVDTWNDPAS